MTTILNLRMKRKEAWDNAKKFLDEHTGESGLLSAEDEQTYDRMEAEVVNLGNQIERMERQEQIDKDLAAPTNSPLLGKPGGDGEAKKPRATAEYAQAFWSSMRGRVMPGAQNVLQIGEDADGGYLVPDEFERQIIDALHERNVIRQLSRIIRTENGERSIPVVASHGKAQWTEENEKYYESDEKFDVVKLSAFKLTRLIRISNELMNDSAFNMQAYLAGEFARSFGEAEEEAFLSGNGDGKPLGILSATGGAQVGVTAASATAITSDELIDLHYSLRAPYRTRATYVTNDATIKAIRKLKDGNSQYIWQPSLVAGTPDTILGRPLRTSPFMPVMAADSKAILFGDFGYYWIADRQVRTFRRLNELYAENGQIGFIGDQRVDGKLILPETIKALQMKSA